MTHALFCACLAGYISSVVSGALAVAAELPQPGSIIDRSNVGRYAPLIPSAMAFAIRNGLIVHVVPTRSVRWPRAYQEATERYSAQVRLDSGDVMQNYVAGLPFPMVNPKNPKAAVKIAYDWHWGPFIPPRVTLLALQKTRAWTLNTSRPGQLVEDDADRDFRNEGSCDQIVIERYMHTLAELADPHHHDSPVEFKQRGNYCGPEPSSYIMIQYLDPDRSSDAWFFPSAIRRWRRMKWAGGYPHQSCTYACAQLWWEYVPPKTESYSYRLSGEQPILACLNATPARPAIRHGQNAVRFGDIDCEIRTAYVLEVTPHSAPEKMLPAKVFLDKETYLLLGAEFYRDSTPDTLVPIWSRPVLDTDRERVELADDFYVPGDRPGFFLSLNLSEETDVLDTSPPSNNLFNPRAQEYDPH